MNRFIPLACSSLILYGLAHGQTPPSEGPSLFALADPFTLGPPNHQYRSVTLSLTGDMWSGSGPDHSVVVTAVAESDEPDDAPGVLDGQTSGDIRVTTADGRVLMSSNGRPLVAFDPRTALLQLRAEHDDRGPGRTYTITVTATDPAGNPRTEVVAVTVPLNEHADEITNVPDPARPGGLEVCTHEYDFSEDPETIRVGKIYLPAFDTDPCATTGQFPLVLIAHADFIDVLPPDRHLQYEGLATHLATRGFVVVSFNRYGNNYQVPGAIDIFDTVLEEHLDFLYNDSPIVSFLADDVALIGHSAGGRSVIRHAGIVNAFGQSLRSLIVIAPTIDVGVDSTFDGVTESFLGLHGSHDMDNAAFGDKGPGLVMKSTFKIHDDAGLIPGDPNALSLTKDMIFIEGAEHFMQNEPFTKAYVNAFLLLHVKGFSIFNRFLKFQLRPPSLGPQVLFQQHADEDRLVVADFENDSDTMNTLNGFIEVSPEGIESLVVDDAHITDDDFSPHHTKVMRFHLDPTPGNNNPNFVTFDLNGPRDLLAFRYLSFRVTQVYHDMDNPDGSPFDFDIELRSLWGEEDSVKISDFGGELHFPVVVKLFGVGNGNQTKNAVRSYLIPLREFDVDVTAVTQVTIDFPFKGHEERDLIFDDIEFYH